MTSPAWHSHHPQDTDVPFEEWVEKIEREARWYYDRAVQPQAVVYLQALRDQAPYYRSPRAERAKADALRKFRAETEEASRLFEETCEVLARDGEVPESLSEKWDALSAPKIAEAAE
jgi:predicted nucleic acid-binding protein